MINFTEIGSDAQVARTTVQEYYQILKDTLIADEVKVWKKNRTRKTFSTAKFYFFDVGVARHLQHRKGLQERSPEYGDAFESYMFHELKSFTDYNKLGDVSYWRTTSGFEVDFILEDAVAVEVKAKSVISKSDLKGLVALKEESSLKHYILVSLEERPRSVDGVTILPWSIFLERLWNRDLC